LKKVYSALTLTLLAAAGGSILAHMIPILANVWINMLGSMFLIYNIGNYAKFCTKLTNFSSDEQDISKRASCKTDRFRRAHWRWIATAARVLDANQPRFGANCAQLDCFRLCCFLSREYFSKRIICKLFFKCALMTQQRSMLYLGSMLSSCLLSMAVMSLMNLFIGRYLKKSEKKIYIYF